MNITKASLQVEIDGKVYFAMLGDVDLRLMVNMIGSLTDSGTLKLIPAPEDFKFIKLDKSEFKK